MSSEKDTVITRLRQEMKESPLAAPAPCRPERRILADGYERQSLEEPLQMTQQYIHRTTRKIIRLLVILIVLVFLVIAVIKAGIISI